MLRNRVAMLAGASGGGGFDVDVTAWSAAVVSAGGTVSGAQKAYVQALVGSLKASGVWASLDRLWLFAAENSTQALIDLVTRTTATAVNSPTFIANQGYTGNGTTSYVNTGFTPSTAGGKFVQNSASLGAWVVTAPTTTAGIECGSEVGAPFTEIGVRFTSVNYRYDINSTASAAAAHGNNWTGAFHVQRTGASALALYRNGTSVATDASASTTLNTGALSFLAHSAGAAPSTAQIGMGWIGASMSVPQLAGLYAAQRAYMTAVGIA